MLPKSRNPLFDPEWLKRSYENQTGHPEKTMEILFRKINIAMGLLHFLLQQPLFMQKRRLRNEAAFVLFRCAFPRRDA